MSTYGNDFIMALDSRIAALEALARRGTEPVTVECRTNIDAFKGMRWPTTLGCVPVIGDRIDGFEWHSNKVVASLRVCGITHSLDRNGKPVLSIELHY